MQKFITENNLPNLKVQALFFVGAILSIYMIVAPFLNLPTIDKDFVMAHAENIIGYSFGILTTILTLVAYFKKPGPGDGIKPAP